MRKTPTNSANIGGLQNEDIAATLIRILKRKGYLVAEQKTVKAKELPIFSSGDTLRLDFYFEGKPEAPHGMAISVKYQETEGTADSKVYHEVCHTIKRCMPCPCVLVLRGDHWLSKARTRARDWAIGEKDGKHLKEVFFSVDDLYKWASNLRDCTGFDSNGGTPGRTLPLPLPDMGQGNLF